MLGGLPRNGVSWYPDLIRFLFHIVFGCVMVSVAVVVRLLRGSVNGLAHVLGALEASDVGKLVDVHAIKCVDELFEICKCYDKVIVAYSLLTTQIPYLFEELGALSFIKRVVGKVVTVAGGPHASADPFTTILGLGFDFAVVGDGEVAFVEIVRSVVEGRFPKAPGIAYFDGSCVRVLGKGFVEDLDRYPGFYRGLGLYIPIEISRGCPFGCKYCQVSYTFGKVMRHRSIEAVVRTVKEYVKDGRRVIRFVTPNAFAYGSRDGRVPEPEKLRKLLASIKSECPEARVYLGTFPSEVRPEFVTRETLEAVHGYICNRRIAIGAQSGSDRVLKAIGRGHTVDDVRKAADLLLEYGYTPYIDFIFGLPGETVDDMFKSIEFIKELAKMGCTVRAHVFMPLPGTPFASQPPGKVPEEVREELEKLEKSGVIDGDWKIQEVLAEKISRVWRVLRRRALEVLRRRKTVFSV